MSKANHLPVVEIFYSLRGEGFHAGSPATFIRLATCNLACPGCDTEFNRFIFTPFEELLRYVKGTGCQWVVFTGGEPLIHDEKIAEFQEYVASKGISFKYQLETNGTFEIKEANFDWITCSPKLGFTKKAGSVTFGAPGLGKPPEAVLPEHLSASLLTEANEFKIIVASWSRPRIVEQIDWLYMQNPEAKLYLQPWMEAQYEANLRHAIELCLGSPYITLSLQTHKITGVR